MHSASRTLSSRTLRRIRVDSTREEQGLARRDAPDRVAYVRARSASKQWRNTIVVAEFEVEDKTSPCDGVIRVSFNRYSRQYECSTIRTEENRQRKGKDTADGTRDEMERRETWRNRGALAITIETRTWEQCRSWIDGMKWDETRRGLEAYMRMKRKTGQERTTRFESNFELKG